MLESTLPRVINFYSTTGEYGCFSNFSRHPIELGGKMWPTSERYFQARSSPARDSVKDQIMLDAVRTKFNQHNDLRATLLGTGDARIVEHTANDSYWGDGGDGSGRNRLGQILTQVREELRIEFAL
jgi:predicted NAD-dependent protein-ADP-ribosyltransferase YbiA (DUF1768 family)